MMKTHAPASEQTQQKAQPQSVPLITERECAFQDKRSETAALQRFQTMALNSLRNAQLRSVQTMMAASPQVQQHKSMRAKMVSSTLGGVQKRSSQTMTAYLVQKMENEESFQAKFETVAESTQLETVAEEPRPNNTGLPNQLKTGIENLSGMSMDYVKVHYNSDKPAQLQAHAYAQGSDIHVAPGQEKHLPHEAWHVVQQAQGRVKPTVQMKAGVQVNDDAGLEAEADLMGERALQMVPERQNTRPDPASVQQALPIASSNNGNDSKREVVSRRIITDVSEAGDDEVQYSAAILSNKEGLERQVYGRMGTVRSTEKEIFVGHSAGLNLFSKSGSEMADELSAKMEKTLHYDFIIAACKTGENAGSFAAELNHHLMSLGMSQNIAAPMNALTIVAEDTFIQGRGFDPWKDKNFSAFFDEHWRAILIEQFSAAATKTASQYIDVNLTKAEGATLLKTQPAVALTTFLSSNTIKDATKGFNPSPANQLSKAAFEWGSKLIRVASNPAKAVETNYKRLMALMNSGAVASGVKSEIEATLQGSRREITSNALAHMREQLSVEDRAKVTISRDFGEGAEWYKESKLGLD